MTVAPHAVRLAALAPLFILAACVSESRRVGDAVGADACADECGVPPLCYEAVWNTDSCTCAFLPLGDDAPCDDGNACTLEDRCGGNQCLGQLVDLRSFCDDGDACTVDNCQRDAGCVHTPAEVDTPCDDGNQCTFDASCNEVGQCRWTDQYVCGLCDPAAPESCADETAQQDPCDGGLVCIGGFCEVDRASVPRCASPRLDPCLVPGCADGVCTTTPLPDDTACSDRSSCTRDDICQGGVCSGAPIDAAACACSAPEDCIAFEDGDLCNGTMTCRDGVCVFDFASIVVCDTSQDTACSVTRCDPDSGGCPAVQVADDSACDDGDPCTLDDVCLGGACGGTARDCSANDGRCLSGVCDCLLGCITEVAPAGSPCTPTEPCTTGAECNADGDCVAPTVGCDDGDPCSADVCDDVSGECSYVGPDKPDCGALGVCRGGVPLVCELGEYRCDFKSVAGWSAVEKCDGQDDDCDGETDEACIAGEACAEGALLSAWSGTMQACAGATTTQEAACGSGWHVCTYTSMVDSLAGDAPPAGYLIAASIAFDPQSGYRVNDCGAEGCFEFDGVCTNAREVQAMSWDGVFGATVAYAAEAWGCDNGLPTESCASAVFAGTMCCADECDSDGDCADDSACTFDRCNAGRCENPPREEIACLQEGVCVGLEPHCDAGGALVCDYGGIEGYQLVELSCDGRDNDCDGASDAADDDFTLSVEACELQAGVCQGALKPAGACVAGDWELCDAGAYAARSSHYQDAFEDLCDGRDNDCDGATDGGFAWFGQALGASCDGIGECGPGLVERAPSRTAATCSSNPLGSASQASAELCNGKDDDCDGETDEAADLDAGESGCGLAGVCAGLPLARCDSGVWRCETAGVDGYGSELCDGLDNDCDGETDEGFGAGSLPLGAPCGPSACPNGVVICAAGGAACSSAVDPHLELCDGVDNDCEGGADEGLSYADPLLGARALGQSCSGRGACTAGVVECGSGLGATCSTLSDGSAAQATLERCDGLDNDCDGATDEGFRWHDLPLGSACPGLGECGPGIVVCSEADPALTTCSSYGDGDQPEATAERCDGLDNDCDGATDEALVPKPGDCPLEGVCQLELADARCEGAAGWVCGHQLNPYYTAGSDARCDRLDNDCDGATDEDVADLGLACDGGDADDCARGVMVCDPTDHGLLVCSGDHASVETCNGEDDDCDGQTDELGAGGCSVYYIDADEDGFGGAASRCACAAADGFTATVGGDCADDDDRVSPGAPELCNGADDDCDGKTDAADAANLVVDDVVACELQAGVCAGADKNANRCVAGVWQPCQPGDYLARNAAFQSPKESRCDGLDNDCDGHSDAADSDIAGAIPLCELQQGPCAGAAKALASCTSGGWAPCTTAIYRAHAPSYEPGVELSCDGKDNECDGFIDDEFAFGGKKVGQSCDGIGVCGFGLVQCRGDGSGATCSTNPDGSQRQDQGETCNALDDDCDGATDEQLGLAQSPCRRVGVCSEQVMASCASGVWDCDYDAVDDYEAASEASCDGLDNDCDGATDEDMSELIGGQSKKKGDPCGAGACAGVMVCDDASSAPGDLVCSAELAGGGEVCDGLDNDCDAQTDEGMVWTPVGQSPLPLGASCDGYGACGVGEVECNHEQVAVCSTNPDGGESEAAPETCNGLDDDCDRTVDDGFSWNGNPVGGACDGVGACGAGVVECTAGGQAATCSTNPDGSAAGDLDEVCNGLDDDCDGQTDEGLDVHDSDCDLTGVCTPESVAAACLGEDGWTCDYSGVPWYHAGDEVGYCDERDNDCDGETDEDYPELGEACDGGDSDMCANGAWVCVQLAEVDPLPGDSGGGQAPGATGYPMCSGDEPSPETCGGGDEDCDGKVDEEGATGCQVYFKDFDQDEYGKQNDFKCLCNRGDVPSYTVQSTEFDCDDLKPLVHPHAIEVCNEIDDDCDQVSDEDGATGCQDYYFDDDGDGWGLGDDARCLCFAYQGEVSGHTAEVDGDCDDTRELVHPTAPELCDGLDNDCDGPSDDEDPPASDCTMYWLDNDGDGFGDPKSSMCRCLPGDKYTALEPGDCCDMDDRAKPEQSDWFPSRNSCGTFDYDCDDVGKLEWPSYGGCDCAPLFNVCTKACVYTPGWAARDISTEQPIPQCGGSGKFVTSCSVACVPDTSMSRPQRCH